MPDGDYEPVAQMNRGKITLLAAITAALGGCEAPEPENVDTARPPAAAPMPENEDISRDGSDAADPGDVGGVPDPAQVPDTDGDGVTNVQDTSVVP